VAGEMSERVVFLPFSYQANNYNLTNELSVFHPIYSNVFQSKDSSNSKEGEKDKKFSMVGTRFCDFNSVHKFEPQVFDVWSHILSSAPDQSSTLSILLPTSDSNYSKLNIEKEFKSRNVNPALKIKFVSRASKSDHLSRLVSDCDVILDTLTYSGHTTTSDALWGGKIVVGLQDGFGVGYEKKIESSTNKEIMKMKFISPNIPKISSRVSMNSLTSQVLKSSLYYDQQSYFKGNKKFKQKSDIGLTSTFSLKDYEDFVSRYFSTTKSDPLLTSSTNFYQTQFEGILSSNLLYSPIFNSQIQTFLVEQSYKGMIDCLKLEETELNHERRELNGLTKITLNHVNIPCFYLLSFLFGA